MVQVYHFKVWNNTKGDWEIPPSKRTSAGIADLKGQIIPDTAEEVDSDDLDVHGRYFPAGVAVQMEKPIDMGHVEKENQSDGAAGRTGIRLKKR